MSKKQEINSKRRKLCQEIINSGLGTGESLLVVRAAFMNGSLPHGVALAWVGATDAYLVNFKKRTAREYVRNGKFLMKRLLLPLRVFIPNKTEDSYTYDEAVKDGVLRPVADNECPGCVNEGWGLAHNQFCDSLRDADVLKDIPTYDLGYLERRYSGERDQYFD